MSPDATGRVAVVTLAHGRHDHLRGLLAGLRAGTRVPDVLVVVAMDDDVIPDLARRHTPAGTQTQVVSVARQDGRLPLAAARNAGARCAARAGADTAGEACPSGLRRLPSGVAGLRRVPTWQSEQD